MEKHTMEKVKEFYKALSSDEAMKERAKAMLDKGKPADEAEAAGAVIAFAKSEGYDFTAEELKAFASAGARELSDEELENVAGGCSGYAKCFCFFAGGGSQDGVTCACVGVGIGGSNPGPGLKCYVGEGYHNYKP
ncbi:MAG: Nif11-like leader peptide family natural product precursor [Holophagales bacterium]|jgi:predicted ribosomally synthesized peptide with nif11-like leader|nr:Nif11-like leader peptide family natural product precursor [Holophagales bacterium]